MGEAKTMADEATEEQKMMQQQLTAAREHEKSTTTQLIHAQKDLESVKAKREDGDRQGKRQLSKSKADEHKRQIRANASIKSNRCKCRGLQESTRRIRQRRRRVNRKQV